MAYVQRNRLEEVAHALQELRWAEMRDLAAYLSMIELDGTETSDFWAGILNDWSNERLEEYHQRCEAKD